MMYLYGADGFVSIL